MRPVLLRMCGYTSYCSPIRTQEYQQFAHHLRPGGIIGTGALHAPQPFFVLSRADHTGIFARPQEVTLARAHVRPSRACPAAYDRISPGAGRAGVRDRNRSHSCCRQRVDAWIRFSSHIAEPQQQGVAGFDVAPRTAESHNTDAVPTPLAGHFGHCSADTTSPEGCLTVSPYYQMAIPPPSSIGWLADAPRPSHPPLQPMAYHPPSPSPGELSISRT